MAELDRIASVEGLDQGARAPDGEAGALGDLHVMLTAREAYPYLERMVLAARDRLTLGFRIFDPDTGLITADARKLGGTWSALIVDALARGVAVTLIVSDFDPIGAPDLHRTTHRSLRTFREAARKAGVEHRLTLEAHRHPARAGPLFRLGFAPFARKQLAHVAAELNGHGTAMADRRIEDMPDLKRLLRRDGAGRWQPRRLAVPHLHPCTHHHKIAVADGTTLYIGGLDLNDRRRDGLGHQRAAGRTWQDVQIGIRGPVAAQAEAHLLAFRAETERRRKPEPRPGLLRTLSGRRRGLGRMALGPKQLVSEIQRRTVAAIAEAQQLVYLETQFLRDTRFTRALAARGRKNPDLGLIVVLPAAPEDVAFLDDTGMGQRFGEHMQAKCVAILAKAFGERVAFVSPAQPRGVAPDGTRRVLCGAPIVYVHSKVSVIDKSVAIVSSANLNGRSHRWDSEAGVALEAPEQVALLRDRLMTHWLPDKADGRYFDPATAPAAWQRLAEENRARQPKARQGFLLPYPRGVPRRFGRPIPFMPQEMV